MNQSLADFITNSGGNIYTKTAVQDIQFDKVNNKWNVTSTKVNGSFTAIIDNSGTTFLEATHHQECYWGAFRIDALLHKGGLLEEKLHQSLPFAYQIMLEEEAASSLSNEHDPLYVTFHQAYDGNGEKVKKELLMTASIHTKAASWSSLTKEQYEQKKEAVANHLLAVIEKTIPIKENIISYQIGTPLTYKKFIGKAEVGGAPLTVKNAILKPKGIRTKYKNYYQVGEQIFPGPGTLSSALSGYNVARAIKNEI